MTRFADPEVFACPSCAAYFTRSSLSSINFSGTREWTDGAPTAWWSVGLRPLIRCSACAALFWIEDLQPQGVRPKRPHPMGRFERLWAGWRGDPHGRLHDESRWLQIPGEWKGAQGADVASFEDIAHVLDNSVGVSSERLIWLRRRIWWNLNDRYRAHADGTAIPNVPSWPEADERANMEALLDLMNTRAMAPGDQVQKGELLRLLGRFDEAIAVLKSVPADGFNEIRAVRIEKLARQGDILVRPLGGEV